MDQASLRYVVIEPTAEDAAAIGRMHLQSWIETYQNPALGVDEGWIREHVGFVADQSGTDFRTQLFEAIAQGDNTNYYRIAKADDDSILGFVHAVKHPESTHDKLDGLYLLERAQGQGVGSTLMDSAMRWLGIDRPVELEVAAYNDHAIAFYEHKSFVRAGEEMAWRDPVTITRMVRAPVDSSNRIDVGRAE